MVPCCQQLSSSRVPLGGLRQVRVESDSSSLCEFLHSVCSPPLCLSLLHPFLGCFHRLRNQLSVSIYDFLLVSLTYLHLYLPSPPQTHGHTKTHRHTHALSHSLTHTLSFVYYQGYTLSLQPLHFLYTLLHTRSFLHTVSLP